MAQLGNTDIYGDLKVTGKIKISTDPVFDNEVARKAYVDSKFNSVVKIDGNPFKNSTSANAATTDTIASNGIGYAGTSGATLFSQVDGGLITSYYSSAYIHQIFGDFRTGQLAVRGKNDGTWQSWRTILDTTNASYLLPLSGGTMTGILTAQANTSYTTRQVRNVIISTAAPSGGSNGDIWLKYA
jgi:hypothetical protein